MAVYSIFLDPCAQKGFSNEAKKMIMIKEQGNTTYFERAKALAKEQIKDQG